MVKRKIEKTEKVSIPSKKPKETLNFFKTKAIKYFGTYADKYGKYFEDLKEGLRYSGLRILFRTYLAAMLFASVILLVSSFIIVFVLSAVYKLDALMAFAGLVSVPLLVFVVSMGIFYYYPSYKSRRRQIDMEANMPFAVNHIAAVASSGAPPYVMFKILAQFKEYGEISKESEKIVRDIDFFGLDEISALKDVITRTPYRPFKEFLEGMSTIIQTGGNLKSYLRQQADKVMFEYRLSRERYLQTLSVYADIYTAILIAAPLLFVTILSILGVIGGEIFGLPIDFVMNALVFALIPLINVLFLIFINATQPKL